MLVAYRRDNVDALNAAARAVFERVGLLTSPELTAPGGRSYRAGDRVTARRGADRPRPDHHLHGSAPIGDGMDPVVMGVPGDRGQGCDRLGGWPARLARRGRFWRRLSPTTITFAAERSAAPRSRPRSTSGVMAPSSTTRTWRSDKTGLL